MPVQVEQHENRVAVRGELRRFDELRVISAALFDRIERHGHRQAALDFSGCEAAEQAVMTPLLPVVARYRESAGASFELTPPDDEQLKRQFIDANWAHYIDPERYPLNADVGEQLPARRFTTETDLEPIVAEVIELLLAQMQVEREALAALEWSMYELMDNALSHAQPPGGGFAQAELDAQSGRVAFVVADGGIGVAESMRIRDHEHALASAVAEGGTRDRAAHTGDGLFGSFSMAALSGEEFEINSGFGLLHTWSDGPDAYRTRKRRIRYSGTAVRCELSASDPELLSRALGFRERAYEPLDAPQLATPFSIRDQAGQYLGSRAGGRRAREIVEERLRSDGAATLDFGGVAVISSGFADELVGRLFAELGPRAFMSRVQIHNANATVNGLIERAILRRAGSG